MTGQIRPRTLKVTALVSALVVAGVIGVSAAYQARSSSSTIAEKEPPAIAALGTPCIGAEKATLEELRALDRDYKIVTPTDVADTGNLKTGWTCQLGPEIFLEYESAGILIEEQSSDFITKQDAGSQGYLNHWRQTVTERSPQSTASMG